MESQPFFNTLAGLSVSLAGFASLIAWLREDPTGWDPINLWRVKTIVRHAFTIAAIGLALSPIYLLTSSDRATVRLGSLLISLVLIAEIVRYRHPGPGDLVYKNVSLGVLQLGFILLLSSPAGIFYNFVRELGIRSPFGDAGSTNRGRSVDDHRIRSRGRSAMKPLVDFSAYVL